MKRNFKFYAVFSFFLLCSLYVEAQSESTGDKKTDDIKISVGGRISFDGAMYSKEYTPLRSGVTLADARVRVSVSINKWDMYYDGDYGRGVFTQKDAYIRYNFNNKQSLRVGYANEPYSSERITSESDLHFLTASTPVLALSQPRALGIDYRYVGKKIFGEGGVFSENLYNNQNQGSQGFSLAGRFVFKPIAEDGKLFQVGLMGRFKQISTGTLSGNPAVLTTNQFVGTGLETTVDNTVNFIGTNIPWAHEGFHYGLELLAVKNKLFLQGEFLGESIARSRPDRLLFENQLGSTTSWQTFSSWQAGNPALTTVNFMGGYVEAGYLIKGKTYKYDEKYALLRNMTEAKALEVVARYSYTDLNDVTPNEVYWAAKKTFYPKTGVIDYPTASTSVYGGVMQTMTLGMNYNFTPTIRTMLHYTHTMLDNDNFVDKNIDMVQLRVQYRF